ncbi:MAG: hypothetical protein P1U74_09635 [Legionellaceae bacterium]|nr:hypothetical protein [Legionellaceae bacterium]
MINLRKNGLILLVTMSLSAFADDITPNPYGETPDDGSTSKYLKNLGTYLGYDLENEATPVEAMLDYTLSVISTGQQILNSFFQAIPINVAYKEFASGTAYESFNSQANLLFESYATADSGGVSVSSILDQQTYQGDPVSQSILNLIGTPDWSSCPLDSDGNTSSDCLSSDKVMTSVLLDISNEDGYLPGETSYFSYKNNSKFASQLSANNLIAPLAFAEPKEGEGSGTTGLPGANQQQLAQQFIRYVTEEVMPLPTMNSSNYGTLFSLAYPADPSSQPTNTMNAKVGLASYLLSLRVYAAKSSVAIANLYSILAKRLPQESGSGSSSDSSSTSQALNEFKMATWRQYNPSSQSNEQWADKINTSSPATIQKEMAILLSEISYQLYLNRQVQERMLLTQSVMLMQLLSTNKPNVEIPGNIELPDST